MTQLRQDYQKFTDRQTEVIAVGPEDAPAFSEFWLGHQMPFPGIPDPEHLIARLYGQKVNPLKLGRLPALVVIDKQGRIRFGHYGNSMSDIPSDRDILSLLDGINSEPA